MAEPAPRNEKLQALRDELLQLEQGVQQEQLNTQEPTGQFVAARDRADPNVGESGNSGARRAAWPVPFAVVGGVFALTALVLAILYGLGSATGLLCVRVSLSCATGMTAAPTPPSTAIPSLAAPSPTKTTLPTAFATPQLTQPAGVIQGFTFTPTAPVLTPTPAATSTPAAGTALPTLAATFTLTPAPQQFRALTLFEFTAVYVRPIGSEVAMVSALNKDVTVYLCDGTTNSERVRYLVSLKPCYLGEPLGYINASTLNQPNPPWPQNRITPYPTAVP